MIILIIYPNQEKIANDICDKFYNNSNLINCLVIGRAQSGKTGIMIATIRQYVKKNIIPTDNIYIITPLFDNDWIKQTKDRVPECIHKNIYHRNHLSKLANEIKNKTNVLLLLDEIHIACKNNQSVNKFINDIGLNNKDEFLKKYKIVEFSATPDGTIYDIETQIYNNDVINKQ